MNDGKKDRLVRNVASELHNHCNQLLSGHEFWEYDYTEEEIEFINSLVCVELIVA